MADQHLFNNPESSWFGIKLATLVAGFAGGVVSLSFLRDLTIPQGVLAVFTGVASAAYLTPVVMHYVFSATSPQLENGVAFAIGLTAMNLIPGVIKLSDMWRRNPAAFFGRDKEK